MMIAAALAVEMMKLMPVVKSHSVSADLKLAAVLRFLAEGGYQHGVGKDFNIAIA